MATCVCVNCCLLRLYVPKSCVEFRSGCGCDFKLGCWWKRATLHVSHGGPAMSACTCFLCILSVQKLMVVSLMRLPKLGSIIMSSESVIMLMLLCCVER